MARKHLGEFEKVVPFREQQPGELLSPDLRRHWLPQRQTDFAVQSKEARRPFRHQPYQNASYGPCH